MKIQAKPVPPLSDNDIARFWSNVGKTNNINDCWEWIGGSSDKNGYSRMHLTGMKFRGQYNVRVSRIAYLIGKKENPNQLLVCHTCDNPKCCNPNHLFLGTNKDNQVDCAKKGRKPTGEKHGTKTKPESLAFGMRNGHATHPEATPKGDKHGMAKITSQQVKEIIEEYSKGGITQTELGEKYGVCQVHISCIVNGKTWKHVA